MNLLRYNRRWWHHVRRRWRSCVWRWDEAYYIGDWRAKGRGDYTSSPERNLESRAASKSGATVTATDDHNVEIYQSLRLATDEMCMEAAFISCNAVEHPFNVSMVIATPHGTIRHHAGCNAPRSTGQNRSRVSFALANIDRAPPDREDRFFGGIGELRKLETWEPGYLLAEQWGLYWGSCSARVSWSFDLPARPGRPKRRAAVWDPRSYLSLLCGDFVRITVIFISMFNPELWFLPIWHVQTFLFDFLHPCSCSSFFPSVSLFEAPRTPQSPKQKFLQHHCRDRLAPAIARMETSRPPLYRRSNSALGSRALCAFVVFHSKNKSHTCCFK